jgi:hypothetical protein
VKGRLQISSGSIRERIRRWVHHHATTHGFLPPSLVGGATWGNPEARPPRNTSDRARG